MYAARLKENLFSKGSGKNDQFCRWRRSFKWPHMSTLVWPDLIGISFCQRLPSIWMVMFYQYWTSANCRSRANRARISKTKNSHLDNNYRFMNSQKCLKLINGPFFIWLHLGIIKISAWPGIALAPNRTFPG